MRITSVVMCIVLLALCTIVSAQPQDVPRGHWAYDAVAKLAKRGLVLGYPDGNFLGDRVLTRYEMACLVARVLANVEQTISAQSGGLVVTKEDIDSVRKLTGEFKVELAVMGTRLDNVESNLAQIQTKVDMLDAAVKDTAAIAKSTAADVARVKRIIVSGYVQSRWQTMDFANQDVPSDNSTDTFVVPRARVKVMGNPTEKTRAVIQVDLGKDSARTKDTYLQYMFTGSEVAGPSVWFGQFAWPFGYEVPTSSSVRETPERALIFRRLFTGERDQGLNYVNATGKPFFWQVGLYNGTGTERNNPSDVNSAKDVLANVHWKKGDLSLGASYYNGKGAWETFGVPSTYLFDVDKVRYGADLQYYANKLTVKAEYVRGKGVDAAQDAWDQDDFVDGYYGQLNYSLTGHDTLVARYSTMSDDPTQLTFGRRNAWELGFIHVLDLSNRVKLFYEINQEEQNEIDNDGLTAEWIVRY